MINGEFVQKVFSTVFFNCVTLAGHRCEKKGCGRVLVLDGNMKNARTVCACKNVGEIQFTGIGGVVIGMLIMNK